MLNNEIVFHNTFGTGKVIELDGPNLKVMFGNVEKTLQLKMVIEKNLLTFENNDIQEKMVYEYITKSNMEENKAKSELLKIWKSYGFEGFLHTTEIDNFKKIVNDGWLIPRNELLKNNIVFNDAANQEVLANTDDIVKKSCRFYYYFKTPTNYRANYQHPVILVFDESLIEFENSFFSSSNAAKNNNGLTSFAFIARDYCWEGIFERGEHSKSIYWKPEESEVSGRLITGMRNAEFLIKDKVSISHIKKVYFKYQKDMDMAKNFCSGEMQKKFCFDRSKFN